MKMQNKKNGYQKRHGCSARCKVIGIRLRTLRVLANLASAPQPFAFLPAIFLSDLISLNF